PGDGGKMYYFPLATGWWKYFSSRTNSFWCCDGTGAEEFSKFADSIYFRKGPALFVNLYIPSELRWPEQGLTLRQDTRFPAADTARLQFTAARPVRMAVNLRIPAWTAAGGSVAVNGRKLEAFANPGSYLTLERTWQSGDVIELRLPMALRAEPLKGDPSQQAPMYGPLVLAARLGSDGLTTAMQYDPDSAPPNAVNGGTQVAPRGRAEGAAAITLRFGEAAEAAGWVQQTGELEFTAAGAELVPLHQILGERYAVYWQVKRALRP
ncbi:MAG TPA: hypothetical protein VFP94_07060, partial [Terriglobales bacterium]|nr:hypothetical protein [Terriglobales bacterium]